MKEVSITKSIISISTPGIHLIPEDNESARKLARQCNDFAAELKNRRPEQFGFWAVIPLPDVQGSLKEISYALDVLSAEGICLETNHHGIYLGDTAFDAVFEELNRRKATIFIHPTTPCIGHQGQTQGYRSAATLPQYPNPMFEFMFDTARALINLFLSGTIARCPDITFVIPHAGGALPPVIQRFTSFATDILGSEIAANSAVVKDTFSRQFYFDLAGFPFPDQICGLLRWVGPDRLIYGSDYPFTPSKGVIALAERAHHGLIETFTDEKIKEEIYIGNARRLLRLNNESFSKNNFNSK